MAEPIKIVLYKGTRAFSLLTILFVVLKLTQVIDWSWWWVMCPLWIPFLPIALMLTVLLAALALAIVVAIPALLVYCIYLKFEGRRFW